MSGLSDVKGWWYAEQVGDWWVIHEGSHVWNGTVFISLDSESLARQVVEAHNAALLSLAAAERIAAHSVV